MRANDALSRERDLVWLAAMVDGEGCIFINRKKAGAFTGRASASGRRSIRAQDSFDVGVKISNTSVPLIEECRRIIGYGSVAQYDFPHGRRTAHIIASYSLRARQLLRELYPHLIAKKHEARLAINCPASGDVAAAAYAALKELHKNGSAEMDLPMEAA
jgi:hypothetical protein